MKKIYYTIIFVVALNGVHAQGIFGKIKNKITGTVSKTADGAASKQAGAAAGDVKYTDPATAGIEIFTFSAKEISDHYGGYNLWFPSFKVVNNQFDLKIAESNIVTYSYSNGRLQKTSEIPDLSIQNKLLNGGEQERISTDFTQTDLGLALMKKGNHVSSGQAPGQMNQTYTFNGKVFAHFVSAQIAHNADSSVVAAVGMSYGNGVMYGLASSNGVQAVLPKLYGGLPLISPDGKQVAALFAINKQVILANGTTHPVNDISNNRVWLRNSGNVFYVPVSNQNVLEMNGAVFYTFSAPVELKKLFISDDEHSMCWQLSGARGLFFSDGSVFENGESPVKTRLNNKDVIVFLDVDLQSGKVYLCQHDL